MSDDRPDFTVTRVVAALDATSCAAETLQAAVELAARFSAEAAGLFIEDINLLRLCGLPVTRHLSAFSDDAEIDLGDIEERLRALAADAETVLKTAADAHHLPWSFQTLRGVPAKELTAATAPRDLLVVGHGRLFRGLPLGLTSGLHDAISRSIHSTLHVPATLILHQPIAVILAGSALVRRTLSAALRLADASADQCDIVVAGEGPAVDATKREAAEWLATQGVRPRFLPTSRLAKLRRAVAHDGHLLVVSADALCAAGMDPEEGLAQEQRSVMIVR